MTDLTGNDQGRHVANAARRARHGYACAGRVTDDVEDAAERNDGAVGDGRERRQLLDLALKPSRMTVEEAARLVERAALRHGEDGRPRRAGDPQRVIAGARMTAKVNRHDAGGRGDLERVRDRLYRPAGEEGHEGVRPNQLRPRSSHDGNPSRQFPSVDKKGEATWPRLQDCKFTAKLEIDGLAAATAGAPGAVGHGAVELFLVASPAKIAGVLLELGPLLFQLAALLVETAEFRRPVIVEGGVATRAGPGLMATIAVAPARGAAPIAAHAREMLAETRYAATPEDKRQHQKAKRPSHPEADDHQNYGDRRKARAQ